MLHIFLNHLAGELLRNTGEFMNSRFKEVCDTILKHKDHKEKIIKRTVISLLPRLAAFASEEVQLIGLRPKPHNTHTTNLAIDQADL